MSDQDMIVNYSEDISTAEKPEPLPVGEYQFEIREVTRAVSAKGMSYCVPMMFIAPEQYPPDYVDGNPDGNLLRGFVSLSDDKAARFRMRKYCETIGAPVSNQLDLNEWVGLSGTVEVIHQEYEGEMQSNAKKITPAQ